MSRSRSRVISRHVQAAVAGKATGGPNAFACHCTYRSWWGAKGTVGFAASSAGSQSFLLLVLCAQARSIRWDIALLTNVAIVLMLPGARCRWCCNNFRPCGEQAWQDHRPTVSRVPSTHAGAAKRKAPAAAAAPALKRATAKAANGETKKPPAAVAAAKAEEDAKAHAVKYWSEYYLMKNEPDDFSIDDLANAPLQTCHWGTRTRPCLQHHERGTIFSRFPV